MSMSIWLVGVWMDGWMGGLHTNLHVWGYEVDLLTLLNLLTLLTLIVLLGVLFPSYCD